MNLFQWFGGKRQGRRDIRRAAGRARPQVEALEDRRVLSLGNAFAVTPFDNDDQLSSANASSPKGRQVVVWTEQDDGIGDFDVRGQLYGPGGNELRSFAVARTGLGEDDPSVAMDNQGNFVVTWTRQTTDEQSDVLAQRFDAAGNKLGGPIKVAVSGQGEFDSDVAMDAQGNFVVSYTVQVSATNSDVRARRFDRLGNPLGSVAVATTTTFDELDSSVAVAPKGQFLVAYTRDRNGVDGDAVVQRYSAQGALQGVLEIDDPDRDERDPDVAMNKFGDAVVAYQDKIGDDLINIKARRVFSSGALGNIINIATDIIAHEFDPAVALNRTSGSFVVAYEFFSFDEDEGSRIEVAEVAEASNAVVRRHTEFLEGVGTPAVSYAAPDNYFLTYTTPTFNDTDIDGRRGIRA